jgi:hypothetical protein
MTMYKTMRLHSKVFSAKRKYQEFAHTVVTSLVGLGLDQDTAQGYLHIIEKDLRQANAELSRFAVHLMLTKKGMTWG